MPRNWLTHPPEIRFPDHVAIHIFLTSIPHLHVWMPCRLREPAYWSTVTGWHYFSLNVFFWRLVQLHFFVTVAVFTLFPLAKRSNCDLRLCFAAKTKNAQIHESPRLMSKTFNKERPERFLNNLFLFSPVDFTTFAFFKLKFSGHTKATYKSILSLRNTVLVKVDNFECRLELFWYCKITWSYYTTNLNRLRFPLGILCIEAYFIIFSNQKL